MYRCNPQAEERYTRTVLCSLSIFRLLDCWLLWCRLTSWDSWVRWPFTKSSYCDTTPEQSCPEHCRRLLGQTSGQCTPLLTVWGRHWAPVSKRAVCRWQTLKQTRLLQQLGRDVSQWRRHVVTRLKRLLQILQFLGRVLTHAATCCLLRRPRSTS